MYTIQQNKNILEVKNQENSVFGKIYLDQGASLQELSLDGNTIIQDLHPLEYKNTYASSILFPFANRIKDGAYTFNNENFQLEINQKEENNAIHGFINDKTFKTIRKEANKNSAVIVLEYIDKKIKAGFPYTYSMLIEYTFTQTSLNLKVNIKNTNTKPFPFTIGWHPYFISDNLKESSIDFDCNKKVVIGDRNITKGVENIVKQDTFLIENKQLDDCWILNSDKVSFNTPKYKLSFSSNAKENFLQAYTPPRLNTIAIEPTTGVSDSFNNNIGLQTLSPDEEYSITWKISIKNY